MHNEKDHSVRRHNLLRQQPTQHWLEGIPTGNGLLGAMTWGGPDELIFTLDRSDLWLSTQHPANELVPLDDLRRFCAGNSIVKVPASSRFQEGLDLLEAIGFRNETQWFVHATRPLLCVRLPAIHFRWTPPALWDKRGGATDPYAGRLTAKVERAETAVMMTIIFDGKPLASILAQAFQRGRSLPLTEKDGQFTAATQPGEEALLLVTIGCLRKPPVPSVEDLRRIVFDCPDWEQLAAEHRRWWREFWSRSGMSLAHAGMDRLWHLGNYFLGANARADSPPISLQGIWCENGIAPWGNRLGWDLNVQACYSPIYTGNHLDLGFSLYDWYRRCLPTMVDFAKGMFGPEAEGAYLQPGTDDLGQTWVYDSCGGYGAGAWVGHFFWQHWLYSGDREFLRDYALPVFREHLKMQRFAWRKEADGHYHLRDRAESPEMRHHATPAAPMRDTAYEIALARFLADAYRQTLRVLGESPDALAQWADDFLKRVVPYPVCAPPQDDTSFALDDPQVPEFFTEWPGLDTHVSHRHLSHLMMIHPLGEIHRFSPHRDLCRARNSLQRLIVRGMGAWCGFTFPWASLMATRLGTPQRMPGFMLELLDRVFTVPFNGLLPGTGYQPFGLCRHSDPAKVLDGTFTLEASLFAVTAVQDALVHGAGEHTVLAGGVPPELDGEFWNLRSAQGDLIAGVIENGKLVSATVTAERAGPRRFAVDDQASHWRGTNVAAEAGHTVMHANLEPGQTLDLR